jgi:protein-tyrosine phosphatase
VDEILPGLLLGADLARHEIETLRVDYVVSALTAAERDYRSYRKTLPVAEYSMELSDSRGTILSFEEVTDAAFKIKEALDLGKRVLVHCGYGRSRSPSVVAAFFLATGRAKTTQEAIAMISRARPCVCPNEDFIAALTRMEKDLFEFCVNSTPRETKDG